MTPNDDFERLLKAQSIRQIPGDWRDSILTFDSAARRSWPGPRAWQALAACWVVIFGLQFFSGSLMSSYQAVAATHEPEVNTAFQQASYQIAWAVIRPEGEQH